MAKNITINATFYASKSGGSFGSVKVVPSNWDGKNADEIGLFKAVAAFNAVTEVALGTWAIEGNLHVNVKQNSNEPDMYLGGDIVRNCHKWQPAKRDIGWAWEVPFFFNGNPATVRVSKATDPSCYGVFTALKRDVGTYYNVKAASNGVWHQKNIDNKHDLINSLMNGHALIVYCDFDTWKSGEKAGQLIEVGQKAVNKFLEIWGLSPKHGEQITLEPTEEVSQAHVTKYREYEDGRQRADHVATVAEKVIDKKVDGGLEDTRKPVETVKAEGKIVLDGSPVSFECISGFFAVVDNTGKSIVPRARYNGQNDDHLTSLVRYARSGWELKSA